MNRKLAIFAAVIAAFAFTCQSADAKWRKHHTDKRLAAVSIGVGAASTAAFFAINDWHWNNWNNSSGLTRGGAWAATTIGCMAVSPMVGTVVVGRPLTEHEAQYLVVSCALPIIGGWLVNAAYDAHPEWEPATNKHHWKHHKKHHAKM
jgi:hypothetical protein